MKRLLVLLALAAAVPGLAACGGGSGGDDLVVYSGRNQDLVGELLSQYQKETGEKLKIRYSDSADLAATLLEEGGNTPADVFLSQDAGALGAVQQEGLLRPLPRAVLDAVDRRYRSSAGRWVGLTARARVIAYDKRKFSPADVPDSVLDVADPRWRGKVGWAPTNPSFETFVTAFRKLRGDDAARSWLKAMVANDTRPFPNNIAVRDAIANGEVELGLINHYYVAEAIAEQGPDYPVGVHFVRAGDPGALVNASGIAVLQSSKRQEQALRLVRYLLSEKGQRYFADRLKEYPLAAGVRPDPSLVPLAKAHPLDVDLSQLSDLRGSVEMIRDAGAL